MSNPDVKNQFGETPLMVAAEKGKIEEVCRLLVDGADVSVLDNEKTTALRKAEHAGHRTIANILRMVEEKGGTVSREDITEIRKKAEDAGPSNPGGHIDIITHQKKSLPLSGIIVSSYSLFIEISLWLSLLSSVIGGWNFPVNATTGESAGFVGALVGIFIWFLIAVVFFGVFLILVDIRNSLKNIESAK